MEDEVQFIVNNGKVLYPNIIQNNLLLYFDAKGKHNTDKYKYTLLDMSRNKADSTLSNFTYKEGNGYAESIDGGLTLDGVNDYLFSESVAIGQEFTVDMYLKIDERTTPQCLFSLVNKRGRLAISQEGQSIEIYQNGDKTNSINVKKIPTNSIHLFSFVFTKYEIRLYIDGISIKSLPFTRRNYSEIQTAVFGCNYPNVQYLKGTIYSVRIYGFKLSDMDVAQNYRMDLERWKK